jgi:uncharacterized protein YegP (UPF0339 family)
MAKTPQMSTKNKLGIHLYKKYNYPASGAKSYWFWHTRAANGRITANGETYSRKSIALNGIRSTAVTLGATGKFKYYDHSKPNVPLTSYV